MLKYHLQRHPKWPECTEFSYEQLHQMGYVLSATCCPNMNARRQLASDLNLEVGEKGVWFKNVRSKPNCHHIFLHVHIIYQLFAFLHAGIIFDGEGVLHASPHPCTSPPLQHSLP